MTTSVRYRPLAGQRDTLASSSAVRSSAAATARQTGSSLRPLQGRHPHGLSAPLDRVVLEANDRGCTKLMRAARRLLIDGGDLHHSSTRAPSEPPPIGRFREEKVASSKGGHGKRPSQQRGHCTHVVDPTATHPVTGEVHQIRPVATGHILAVMVGNAGAQRKPFQRPNCRDPATPPRPRCPHQTTTQTPRLRPRPI